MESYANPIKLFLLQTATGTWITFSSRSNLKVYKPSGFSLTVKDKAGATRWNVLIQPTLHAHAGTVNSLKPNPITSYISNISRIMILQTKMGEMHIVSTKSQCSRAFIEDKFRIPFKTKLPEHS
jgi:hypothetical protein